MQQNSFLNSFPDLLFPVNTEDPIMDDQENLPKEVIPQLDFYLPIMGNEECIHFLQTRTKPARHLTTEELELAKESFNDPDASIDSKVAIFDNLIHRISEPLLGRDVRMDFYRSIALANRSIYINKIEK